MRSGAALTVIGGPGTGKTALLMELHRHLVTDPSVGPDEVLVLTPSRESATALRDRLEQSSEQVRSSPAARSLHSLAFGLVSAQAAQRDGAGTKFVSGADQDALLAEMLDGYETGRASPPRWPERMNREVRSTAGFRNQLREVLNRVMELGFTPADVQRAARAQGRPEWSAVAEVLQDYEDQLAVPVFGGVDTSAVLAEAGYVLHDEFDAGTVAGGSWTFSTETVPRYLLVDAAQDLPDAALGVLSRLRDLGSRIAVFASPDTAVQGFRGGAGAVVSAAVVHSAPALAGPAGHRRITLDPATAEVRGAGAIAAVVQDFARRVSPDLVLGHVPRSAEHAPVGDSRVSTAVHVSSAEQSRAIAGLLRAWHHDEGIPWSECAVIGRTSGTAAALRQELRYLGIPVDSDRLPLGSDPATAPLLQALTVGPDSPQEFAGFVHQLLAGPYFEVDAISLRGLEREVGGRVPGASDGSTPLSRAVTLLDAGELPEPLRTVAQLVETAAAARHRDPHAAVWQLWQTLGVAQTWRRRSLNRATDPANDRLDAVLRLITMAEKLAERESLDARSFAALVLEQDFAQDSLAAQRSLDLVAVDSPTALAHVSFARVIVVDLDEGTWPNPKVRGSLFRTTDLLLALTGAELAAEPAQAYAQRRRATLVDEARLFLSAASRARGHLVVMALDDGDTSPSVFYDTVAAHPAVTGILEAADPEQHRPTGCAAASLPVSLRSAAALARNRLVATSATETAAGTETAADSGEWADLLNALAGLGVREARPENWSSWQRVTTSVPLLDAGDVARVSPSEAETFAACRLRWFLTHHGGRSTSSRAQSLGTLVHQVAETCPDGGLAAMLAVFEEGFGDIEYAADWERARDRELGRHMVTVLNDYLKDARTRDGLSEVAVEARIDAESRPDSPGAPWRISGRVDRLEIYERSAADGAPQVQLRVVDFKTGRQVVSRDAVLEHPQLGVYQVALGARGAVLSDGRRLSGRPGGGELVYLRKAKPSLRVQPALEPSDQVQWADRLVGAIADGMRSATFAATPSPDVCRSCPVRSSCPAFAAAPNSGEDV